MSPTSTYNFKHLRALLDSAGISIVEAACLFKVSRPTMYSWCAGTGPNQELLLENALSTINAIELAVKAEDLPVAEPTCALLRSLLNKYE
mgnify:CR=1 FL=1